MTNHDETLGDDVLARRKELAAEMSERSLRIAVLGPSLEGDENFGSRKRRQIANSLTSDGHHTFFPEEYVSLDDPLLPGVEQERQLLSNSAVDLVIVLHTEDSAGVLVEIGNFASVPEINIKTGVLFPVKYYWPTQNLSGNTLQAYFTTMQYTEEHLETCELVAVCRRWAYQKSKGIWPTLPPEGF